MQKIFNTLIDSYIEDGVGITENFLSKRLSLQLIGNLNTLYNTRQLLLAGTGNDRLAAHDTLYRSDIIYWLDREHNNVHENSFFDVIDKFVLHLNNTCYAGITSYEFHYAMYEKGSFYKTHVDQFHNNESRQYSLIIYLNEDWQKIDGGELCIHHKDHVQVISPMNGRSVFFKSSELEHEVLVTNKPRLSIAGWLKIDKQIIV